MKVLQLTEAQKDSILGNKYDGVQSFNPVQDADSVWIISLEEKNQCTNTDFISLLDSLPEIDYKQPEYEI
jgi:hypothetical protein